MESVQERLRAAREERVKGPIRLPVPGFADGALVARYRPVEDWASVQPFVMTDNPTVELNTAADTLISSCEGTEAHIDGEVTELPHKLGYDLAEYLGFDVSGEPKLTDRQALFVMLPQARLMAHYLTLTQRSKVLVQDAEEAVAGESRAG